VFAPRTGPFLALAAAGVVALALGLAFASNLFLRVVYAASFAVGLVLWLFFAYFFRDPERDAGAGIVSGADGRVHVVVREGDRWRIGVFMGVTSVHVNRFPLAGRVESVSSESGGHRPAYRPDASANARRHYRLQTSLGPVELVQTTGVFARRLVSFVGPGDERPKGARLGMIVFGSRFDVLLPADRVEPAVRVGDRVWGGSSAIAREVGP
jgi:phosphatidylserine decarboxylase